VIVNLKNKNIFSQTEIKYINDAANEIKNGGVVAFPTETVYGLGASIFNTDGIKKIYSLKKRPSDNPLIAHISDLCMIDKLVVFENKQQKEIFNILSKILWPGPISFILPSSPDVPEIARGGLSTIAIRMPDNPIALELINYTGCAIVAPSANISGKPSCTNAESVEDDFGSGLKYILDGGETSIGIESFDVVLKIKKSKIYCFI